MAILAAECSDTAIVVFVLTSILWLFGILFGVSLYKFCRRRNEARAKHLLALKHVGTDDPDAGISGGNDEETDVYIGVNKKSPNSFSESTLDQKMSNPKRITIEKTKSELKNKEMQDKRSTQKKIEMSKDIRISFFESNLSLHNNNYNYNYNYFSDTDNPNMNNSSKRHSGLSHGRYSSVYESATLTTPKMIVTKTDYDKKDASKNDTNINMNGKSSVNHFLNNYTLSANNNNNNIGINFNSRITNNIAGKLHLTTANDNYHEYFHSTTLTHLLMGANFNNNPNPNLNDAANNVNNVNNDNPNKEVRSTIVITIQKAFFQYNVAARVETDDINTTVNINSDNDSNVEQLQHVQHDSKPETPLTPFHPNMYNQLQYCGNNTPVGTTNTTTRMIPIPLQTGNSKSKSKSKSMAQSRNRPNSDNTMVNKGESLISPEQNNETVLFDDTREASKSRSQSIVGTTVKHEEIEDVGVDVDVDVDADTDVNVNDTDLDIIAIANPMSDNDNEYDVESVNTNLPPTTLTSGNSNSHTHSSYILPIGSLGSPLGSIVSPNNSGFVNNGATNSKNSNLRVSSLVPSNKYSKHGKNNNKNKSKSKSMILKNSNNNKKNNNTDNDETSLLTNAMSASRHSEESQTPLPNAMTEKLIRDFIGSENDDGTYTGTYSFHDGIEDWSFQDVCDWIKDNLLNDIINSKNLNININFEFLKKLIITFEMNYSMQMVIVALDCQLLNKIGITKQNIFDKIENIMKKNTNMEPSRMADIDLYGMINTSGIADADGGNINTLSTAENVNVNRNIIVGCDNPAIF